MTFPEAIVSGVRKYADFTGRSARSDFWWFILFIALVSAAVGTVNIVTPQGDLDLRPMLTSLWSIATIVPTLAITVRRLRDAGRNWAEVFWFLVPIAGLIVLAIHLSEPSTGDRSAQAPDGTRMPA